MKLKSLITLFVTLFATAAFAQMVDPSQIGDNFIMCSSQTQTEQLMIPVKNGVPPTMGQYIVTDAPGSQNILEMVQLNVATATFDNQTVMIQATSMLDPSRDFSITANAVGEFNITPTFKTLVYLGTLNNNGYTCVVLSAAELSQLAPQ